MIHNDKILAIQHIRPNAKFILRDETLEWLDETQIQPSEKEIEAGWVAYKLAQEAEAESKATQKAALLNRLGITDQEAKLLLA